jgi:hypothetical protein
MSPLFENDERRAWISFLQATGGMLPCEQCRDHYKAWIQKNPVSSIQTLPYNELKGFITLWIWNLHHDVNVRLGRFSSDTYVEPAYTDLATLYSSTALDSRFKILELIEKSAIRQQGVSLTGWMLWTKQFRTLVGVYGM